MEILQLDKLSSEITGTPLSLLTACGLSVRDGEIFDTILKEHTGYLSFASLFDADLLISPRLDTRTHEILHLIADVYDDYQEKHGDGRQIIRTESFSDWLERNE